MNKKRNFTKLEKFGICWLAMLHIIMIAPIAEILPVKEDKIIPQAHAQIANQPPVIQSINAILVTPGQDITLPAIDEGKLLLIEPQVHDPDGDYVTFTYEAPFDSSGNWQIPYDFVDKDPTKSITSKITASDGTTSNSVNVNIIVNNKDRPPVVSVSLSNSTVKPGEEFDIHVEVNDPDVEAIPDDASLSNHPVIYEGSAQLDTQQKKFGTTSLSLDGNDSYITIPDSPDWDLSNSNFTIDAWVYKYPNERIDIFTQYQNVRKHYFFVNPDGGLWFRGGHVSGNPDSVQIDLCSSAGAVPDNIFTHVAVVRNGNNWNLYVNGSNVAFTANSSTLINITGDLIIGAYKWNGYNKQYNRCYIDELRFSKGIARWTSNFTPPQDIYSSVDSNTKLLLHFDVPNADPLELKLFKDGNDITGITQYIYGSGSFNKSYDISTSEVGTFTARITDPKTGQTYEGSTYVEVVNAGAEIKSVSGDFNGDGVTDIGYLNTNDGSWHISLAANSSFNAPTEWLTGFGTGGGAVPLTGDFNGDGLTDIVYFNSGSGTFNIKFSDGISSFVDITTSPVVVTSNGKAMTGWYGNENKVHIPFAADFNGDGLTDLGYYHNRTHVYGGMGGGYSGSYGGDKHIAYSTGEESDGYFKDFVRLPEHDRKDCIPIATDFNGDGLADFCTKEYGNWQVIFSKGDGLVPEASKVINITNFGDGKDPVVGDFNQDGLLDIGYFDSQEGKIYYRIFKGNRFDDTTRIYISGLKTGSRDHLHATTGDYNGDGILDAATFDKASLGINKWSTTLHNSKLPDLLVEIDNGIGGTTSIEYERSTKLDNKDDQGKEKLPFPVRVVKKVTKTDGLGHSYETSYEYAKGVFETDSREFRGFGYVRVADPEGHYKETYFNQDDIYKGRPSKEVVYDKYNRKIQEVDYDWQSILYHSQLVTFPYLDSKTTTLYDYKTGDSKEVQTLYDYDDYGNVVKIRNEGFLDETGDEKESNITYEYNVTKWIVSKPKTSETTGSPAVKSQYTYDDNGSLLKEEKWLDTESKWISTDFTYDSYGNVLTVKDALSRTTTTTYDSTKTFPASVSNAVGHTQSFTYDYATGKILTSTDPNGQTTTSIYDGFGRLTKVTGPGSISEVTYTYDLTLTPVKISSTTKVSDTETTTSYSWADGLGRTIENISEADNGKYVLSGLVKYDSRGQVIEKYLPTYVTGTDYVAPTFDGKHVTYVYDPLGRVVQTIRPDNKVSQNIYAITSVETINENAQRKRVTKDAYGRIKTVEEFNAGSTYTTTYDYDTLDNLTKTTDAVGNITTIKYDSLGRKIDMNDPDMGTWVYSYDDVGNLTSQTDAKGQTITFNYDQINRLTSKTTGVDYTYDQGANSVGRLSSVTDSSGTTEFFYDILGREIKTIKTVGSTPYIIEREYDSLDRLTSVKYPDTVIVKYEYNKQGGIKKAYSPGTGGDVIYISNTTYNANGQITCVEYGNGTSTDYTYDEDNLRLTNLNTLSGSNPVQNLSYTFDSVGNVKQITDAVNSNTQSFSYDDLNRLTSATGPHYSTINYAYDPIGNMTQKGDKTLVYGEGAAGPHAVTKYGDTVIAYDANGNMETKGTASYAYDTENRLTEVAIPRGGEVSSVTLNFAAGWNFFSIPYKLVDQSGTLTPIENIPIGALLIDINGKYDQIDKYDEAINDPNTGHWQHYVGNSKFDQFSYFNYGEGYLIYANTACSLTLTGSTPASAQAKTLNAGWTLTLGPTDTSISVQDALEGVSYDSVKVYNGSTYDDASTFEAGEAYWIHTASAQTWSIQPKQDLTEFVYDGDGGRTKRIYEDRTTIYIGSSYEIEIDNTTGDVLKYKKLIQMGSTRVCEVEQEGEDIHAYFVHADHISSSNIITDESGSRVSLFEYKPFGSVAYAAEDNAYDTDKRFTGKTYDKTTGLHYYGARYYDSELGRFTSADPTIQHPYDPQDFNRYAYARNNPIKYTDPTGLGFWSWIKSFFKGLVGVVLTAILTPVFQGNIVAAAMVSGAITGAIFGAIDGGLKGALMGAAWGAGFGMVLGTIGIDPGLMAFAILGMGTYAGITGGGEGLANFGAGLTGAAVGSQIGSALVGQSTVKTEGANGNANNGQGKSEIKQQVSQKLNQGKIVDSNDIRSSNTGNPPAKQLADNQAEIAKAGQEGKTGQGNNSNYSKNGGFVDRLNEKLGIDTTGKYFDSKAYWAEYGLHVTAPGVPVAYTIGIVAVAVLPPPFDILAGVLLFSASSGAAIQSYKDAWLPIDGTIKQGYFEYKAYGQ